MLIFLWLLEDELLLFPLPDLCDFFELLDLFEDELLAFCFNSRLGFGYLLIISFYKA